MHESDKSLLRFIISSTGDRRITTIAVADEVGMIQDVNCIIDYKLSLDPELLYNHTLVFGGEQVKILDND